MELLASAVVERRRGGEAPATIELLFGDLSVLPAEHAVDALVVSAFPDSYTPDPGTLFASLYKRDFDMREVARRKAEDQRARLGCWISERLTDERARKFGFLRVICFEPLYPAFVEHASRTRSIEDAVGFLFRCLNNFIIPDITDNDRRRYAIRRVAMPLLATGNQRVPVEELLPRLIAAAIFWLEEGLPIETLKIVAFGPEHAVAARRIFTAVTRAHAVRAPSSADPFRSGETGLAERVGRELIEACSEQLRQDLRALATDDERGVLEGLLARLDVKRAVQAEGLLPRLAGPVSAGGYDVFVSYAHAQDAEVRGFVAELQRQHPQLRIFYDRQSIPTGGQWIRLISEAVGRANAFIAVLSPDYTASPVCWDEFQCAKLKEYTSGASIIRTVRLYAEKEPPPIMAIHSYTDCTEGDLDKLRAAAAAIALQSGRIV
jgi:hypothetical protein